MSKKRKVKTVEDILHVWEITYSPNSGGESRTRKFACEGTLENVAKIAARRYRAASLIQIRDLDEYITIHAVVWP